MERELNLIHEFTNFLGHCVASENTIKPNMDAFMLYKYFSYREAIQIAYARGFNPARLTHPQYVELLESVYTDGKSIADNTETS